MKLKINQTTIRVTEIISIEDLRRDFKRRGITKEKATDNILLLNLPDDREEVLKIVEEIFPTNS